MYIVIYIYYLLFVSTVQHLSSSILSSQQLLEKVYIISAL